jgi:hypothetical protein
MEPPTRATDVDSQTFDLHADYRDDFRAPPPRPSHLIPVAAALGCTVEVVLLLIVWSHARATPYRLFHDVPVFLMAALPFAAMAGIGLLVRRDRGVQTALLPLLAIMTVAGLWAAATKTTHTRGGFEIIGLILAYLLQWVMVGLSVLTGFVALALTRR